MAIYGNIESLDAVVLGTITAEPIHIDGEDGVGVVRIYIEEGRLKYELTDGTIGDAGSATGVEVDDTLSIEGAAADAKATGDALAEKLDKSGGTMSGDLNLNSNVLLLGDCGLAESNTNTISLVGEHENDTVRLRNLNSPTNDNDAANKKYVDEHAGGSFPPVGGVTYNDMSSGVKASLDLADSALQSHQSLSAYRTSVEQDTIDSGKVDKVNGAANGSLVYFNSNGGIKASGKNVVTALGNNDYTIPTSKAVKDYVDTHGGGAFTEISADTANAVSQMADGAYVTKDTYGTWAYWFKGTVDGAVTIYKFECMDDNTSSFYIFQGTSGDVSQAATIDSSGTISVGGMTLSASGGVLKFNNAAVALKSDLDDYVAISQGVAHAGKFLVVGDNGNVTTMTLAVWEGGSYGS